MQCNEFSKQNGNSDRKMLGLNEWDNCVLGRVEFFVNVLALEDRSVKSLIKYSSRG